MWTWENCENTTADLRERWFKTGQDGVVEVTTVDGDDLGDNLDQVVTAHVLVHTHQTHLFVAAGSG